jgi:hypothetical protein
MSSKKFPSHIKHQHDAETFCLNRFTNFIATKVLYLRRLKIFRVRKKVT